uniref:Uncharacterized protein n=1 Tax=Romanomermis culicivorax TaxID=13658 RepID=A0A915JNY8_ROMCU
MAVSGAFGAGSMTNSTMSNMNNNGGMMNDSSSSAAYNCLLQSRAVAVGQSYDPFQVYRQASASSSNDQMSAATNGHLGQSQNPSSVNLMQHQQLSS